MPKRKTYVQFKKEIFDLVGNEYTFLDTYVNSRTKLRVKHNKCGRIYKILPSNFLKGNRCPYCSTNANKSDVQFKKEVSELVGDEYTFIDDYVNNSTKIRVKHNKCGYIYKVNPGNFLMGRRCPRCSGCMKKTYAQFKKEVFDLVGDEYVFLDPYVNAYTKLKVKHNKCGHIYEVRPHDFFRGNRCPYCYGTPKKTDTQFKQEIQKLVGGEYVVLGNYATAKTKLRIKHNKCGNVYAVQPTNFLQGYRCPYCNSPKGEDIINKILKSLGVKFEYQKSFDNLIDKDCLSYDFFIPSQNILIEYQGIQHYESVDHFGGESQFKVQQKHDKMKANYAKEHGYNLIAIPYTEDTFSKIKKYLIKHGLR